MANVAVFRADASSLLGSGHIMRCLALADGLARHGWKCLFAVGPDTLTTVPRLKMSGHRIVVLADPEEEVAQMFAATQNGADLLVVDHYSRDAAMEFACRHWVTRILAIDDLADRCHNTDFLLDQTMGRHESDYQQLLPREAVLMLGPSFALLRPEFASRREEALARRDGRLERVLISFGGSDPLDVTPTALRIVLTAGLEAEVVIGSVSPNRDAVTSIVSSSGGRAKLHVDTRDMASLMTSCDLAIGAGGTTSWERCTLGLPSIVVVTADNQALIARELDKVGAGIVLGRWQDSGPQAPGGMPCDTSERFHADLRLRVVVQRLFVTVGGVERVVHQLQKYG